MKKNLLIALALFIFVGLGSWVARTFGFYYAYWYTDVILHLTAGTGFGLIWVAFNQKAEKRKLALILAAASFAVLGSVVWEIWEFAGWRIMPSGMRYYIPELGDTLGDICSGFLGGALAGIGKRGK